MKGAGERLSFARYDHPDQVRALTVFAKHPNDLHQKRLRDFWINEGVVARDAIWALLSGGRTNQVWRVGDGPDAVVCKFFSANGGTPLFPNNPAAEAVALRALEGTGIAPTLIATRDTGFGQSLIYTFVAGRAWRSDVEAVARLLRRLHDTNPPKALSKRPTGPDALLKQGHALLDELGTAGDRLRQMVPANMEDNPQRRVFLHGDVVPGNLLQDDHQLTLIDWQCPAIGDPCDDLAVFLSPAMQTVNANAPLTAREQARFLEVYGNAEVVARYLKVAPIYHWRMAAYCLWKSCMGDAAYQPAADLEIARLEQG